MTKLTITEGLPGSGKSTWARNEAALTGAALVSRDEIRAMIWPGPGPWPHGDQAWEDRCTAAQLAMVEALLQAGVDVIVHDINLSQEHRRLLLDAGIKARAVCGIKLFTDVPLETCIERDAARPNPVGEAVIRRMWTTYLAPQAEKSRQS